MEKYTLTCYNGGLSLPCEYFRTFGLSLYASAEANAVGEFNTAKDGGSVIRATYSQLRVIF